MYDIVTIGSATQDVFLASKAFKLIRSNEFVGGIAECVSFGSKIDIEDIAITSGGGGTNAAATCSALGLNSAVIARIGDDVTGKFVREELEKYKINDSLIKEIKGGKTGFSTLLTASNGERSVLVHRGVSSDFSEEDIPWDNLQTKWLYITSLAGNISLMQKLIHFATSNKIRVAYNPGSKELHQGLRTLQPILRNVDILSLNVEELKMLSRSKDEKPNIRELCEKIHHKGMVILITDGGNGAYAYTDKKFVFARTRNVPVISRTGAGDAFGSGFVTSIIKGLSLDDALRVATLNAESVIGSFGAKIGILEGMPSNEKMSEIKIITK